MAKPTDLCIVCYDTPEHMVYMPCGQHRYCDSCLCTVLARAIAREIDYPIACGSSRCPRPSLQELEVMLTSFPTIQANQPDDLLARYASRLLEYNTPILHRIYCSNRACMLTQGSSRFLDINTCGVGNGSRVRCPDCNTTTCVNCKGPWNGPNPGNHSCILAARDAEDYIASLPEDEKWKWRKCVRCNTWGGKMDEESCNHMACVCGYQFCLICGREWGYVLCVHGCPKKGPGVYDAEDYNESGYHRVTGRNRARARRALDALESDELPHEDMADEDNNDDTTRHGHIYTVPYLGRIMSPELTVTMPVDMPSLRASLTDRKFWALLILHTLTIYGLVVLLHNMLAARGYAYNGWGMDRDGYDMKGYNFYGVDRKGRDRNCLDPTEAAEALGQEVAW